MPVIILALVLVGWFPFFYLRFRRDGKGRALFRGALWGLFMMVPTFVVSGFTYRLPAPLVYPLVFLGGPFLTFMLCSAMLYTAPGARANQAAPRKTIFYLPPWSKSLATA